jgi:predicted  nucleic acid-binding Zn-ribbon protein
LSAQIDELSSVAAKLAEDITELNDAVAAINADVAERAKQRQEEKEQNSATIADAQEASAAVAEAVKVLKEFYAKAADATAFIQPTSFAQRSSKQPLTFDEPYQGMQAGKGGVLGMLDVIASDFARLEADTSAAEDEAVREFEAFSNEAAENKAVKETEARHKGFKKTRAVRDLNQAKKDLEATQAELDAALEHFEKLKPTCVGETPGYENRVARRKEEIASLQEALTILSGEDVGL